VFLMTAVRGPRFWDGEAERLGGLEVDDEAQHSCVFKGLPTQTILTAIIEPQRLFPPRCKHESRGGRVRVAATSAQASGRAAGHTFTPTKV